MTPQCKECEFLGERFGFCPVVNDWVRPAKDWVSFLWTDKERKDVNCVEDDA